MKEKIGAAQMVCLTAFFTCGVLMTGAINKVGHDLWLAAIFAAIIAIPFILIVARLSKLQPEKDLFEIAENALGKLFGKLTNVIFLAYAVLVCAVTLRTMTEFVHVVAMPRTPRIFTAIAIILVCAYAASKSVTVVARSSVMMLAVFILIILVLVSGSKISSFASITPVFDVSVGEMANQTGSLFLYLFPDIFFLLVPLSQLKTKRSVRNVLLFGFGIGFIILFVSIFISLLSLGERTFVEMHFPLFESTSTTAIGGFIQRIEVVGAISELIATFIKLSIVFHVAARGIVRFTKAEAERDLVFPLALLIAAVSVLLFGNTIELRSFVSMSFVFSLVVVVALPVVIWVATEIRHASDVKKSGAGAKVLY